MSDFFGIGQALKGAARIYFRSARQTGRTTMLLYSLKEGDRVVFSSAASAARFRNMLNGRDIKGVQCVVVPPSDPGKLAEHPTPLGRAIFDHEWLEEFYELALDSVSRDVRRLETQFGGYGEAHYQTKMKANQRAERQAHWNFVRSFLNDKSKKA